jgi:predicted permease
MSIFQNSSSFSWSFSYPSSWITCAKTDGTGATDIDQDEPDLSGTSHCFVEHLGLNLESTYIAHLPFSGFCLVLAGGAMGYLFMPFVRLHGKSRATFIISSSLANHGLPMGGFLCYLFPGGTWAWPVSDLYIVFMPFIFLVVFSYDADHCHPEVRFSMKFLRENIINMQNMPLYALYGGALSATLGIKRPSIFFPIDLILLISVSVYYFTLGINFNVKNIFSCFRENGALIAIKFLFLPMMTLITLKIIPLDNLVSQVILIQSFMPTAIYSVVAPVLFNLDTRLATNLFVINTVVFIVFVLPVLFIFHGNLAG